MHVTFVFCSVLRKHLEITLKVFQVIAHKFFSLRVRASVGV